MLKFHTQFPREQRHTGQKHTEENTDNLGLSLAPPELIAFYVIFHFSMA